jgi:hypothetical protein
LVTDDPSAFLLQLVQGLVTAYGGELGDWSVLKASFKGTLPLIKANDSLLAPVSLTSIDFYEDDGQ